MVARAEEKRERIRYSGKEGVAMSKEFAQKEACIVPEGVFVIGPVVGRAFHDGLKLKK